MSDRYHPAQIDEMEDRRSLISEPLPPDNVIALPKARSLYAVLCQALIDTQSLLVRLEAGVHVLEAGQRETVRQLYVASRAQVKALTACLELEGLE